MKSAGVGINEGVRNRPFLLTLRLCHQKEEEHD